MDRAVKSRLESLLVIAPQEYESLVVLPLAAEAEGRFPYLTLAQALAAWEVAVTEVSTEGSVPEVHAINRSKQPVLLVGGEELAGAKQNRVLNTSILLREVSETRIPVTSTEAGRWRWSSKSFRDSGNVMARATRARKTRSVSQSLLANASFHSDQEEVWSGLAELQAQCGTPSPTAAMEDLFKACEARLTGFQQAFAVLPSQIGLLVLISGQPVGLELVSRADAYAHLHPKLIRSYALEAMLARTEPGESVGAIEAGQAFIRRILASEERCFPSIGYGTDHRYCGPALAGAALVHQQEVVHAAFFALDEPGSRGSNAASRDRKQFVG